MIPVTRVQLGDDVEKLVLEVVRSGQLAQGPMVARFEDECRAMAGTEHAVAVNNGTTALVLALEALELAPGDEVITSPFTFVATLNAILEAGATARFGDIGDDFNLDPASIEALIGPRTRVIMPVHLYGLPADMDRIVPIAERHGLAIVEDAAQAHGASIGDRLVGSYGVGCFSFYATKNISTGEGGVITTNDGALADRMRVLRNQGMRVRYQYELAGHNYRLTDLAAAVGIPQFARRAELTESRRRNARALSDGLDGTDGLVIPLEPVGRRSVWHQYTVRLDSPAAIDRQEFMDRLAAAGVGSGIYYPKAVYDYDCYRENPRVVVDGSPRAETVAASVVSLPVHTFLSADDLGQIVIAVRIALG